MLGRNVGFVFSGIGREIGGIGAQIAAVLRGDFKGAGQIGDMIKADAAAARKALDEADARTLGDRKLWGQQMREEWAKGAAPGGNADAGTPSKLKAPVDPEAARKQAAQRAAARAYYEGLLADTQTGLAKIAAEQKKAEAENDRRQAEAKGDKDTMKTLLDARLLIVQKFERERAALEETYAKDRAAADIAVTTDEQARIMAIRNEAFRAADADVKLGVKTFEQGENAKRVAAFQTGEALKDLAERNAAARFNTEVARTRDTETLIRMERDETIRRAQAAADRGKITAEELAAAEVQAERKAQDQIRALRDSRTQTNIDTLQIKATVGGTSDTKAQEELIRAQAAQRIQATLDEQATDLANQQAYADRRFAIEADLQRRLNRMRTDAKDAVAQAYGAMANSLGMLTEVLYSEGGKQDAFYRASFIAQKAFALASAIVNIQSGIAKASNESFPLNILGMAQVAAATASIISTIKGTNYGGGRQYGGPVSAGSMYRVNETGRPEMYTAANGAQYMLPTASGNVTPADQVGGANGGSAQRPIYVTQHFTVQQGTSTQTQQQMATAAARGLQQALARNG